MNWDAKQKTYLSKLPPIFIAKYKICAFLQTNGSKNIKKQLSNHCCFYTSYLENQGKKKYIAAVKKMLLQCVRDFSVYNCPAGLYVFFSFIYFNNTKFQVKQIHEYKISNDDQYLFQIYYFAHEVVS